MFGYLAYFGSHRRIAFRALIRATAAAPPCALHTINRWLVIASIPHGVPSRLVAVHRRRFVLPFLKADFIIAIRQPILPAPTGWGFGMSNPPAPGNPWALYQRPETVLGIPKSAKL